MSISRIRHGLAAAAACAVAIAAIAASGAAVAQTVTTGAFRNLAGLDAVLQRGVTTKAEVRKAFGVPNGSGAAQFFTLGGGQREVWYYEDIEATGATSTEGVMHIQMRQQLLIVMFKAERVDGYLWTSNSGTAEAK